MIFPVSLVDYYAVVVIVVCLLALGWLVAGGFAWEFCVVDISRGEGRHSWSNISTDIKLYHTGRYLFMIFINAACIRQLLQGYNIRN